MEKEVLKKLQAMGEQAKKLPKKVLTEDDYVKDPHFFSGIKTKEQADIFKTLLFRLLGKSYPLE